jgi:hypothetical protein
MKPRLGRGVLKLGDPVRVQNRVWKRLGGHVRIRLWNRVLDRGGILVWDRARDRVCNRVQEELR